MAKTLDAEIPRFDGERWRGVVPLSYGGDVVTTTVGVAVTDGRVIPRMWDQNACEGGRWIGPWTSHAKAIVDACVLAMFSEREARATTVHVGPGETGIHADGAVVVDTMTVTGSGAVGLDLR